MCSCELPDISCACDDCRWSLIAAQLPGRTDNDVKNHWNTKLKKKLSGMGIDPVTHKSFSHLMAEIANTLAPPQVAHLAEAALGCFKDEMLHLLTKKRIDFSSTSAAAAGGYLTQLPEPPVPTEAILGGNYDREETIQRIKMGLSRAIMPEVCPDKGWGAMEMGDGEDEPHTGSLMCNDMYTAAMDYRYGNPSTYENDGEGSAWSTCAGGGGGAAEEHVKSAENRKEADDGKEGSKEDAGVFESDCVLWELTDDLMNHIV